MKHVAWLCAALLAANCTADTQIETAAADPALGGTQHADAAAAPAASSACTPTVQDDPGQTLGSHFWYGTDALAALIAKDGRWPGRAQRGDRNKLFWRAAGFTPGLEKQFSVTARHLADATLTADISPVTNARFVDARESFALVTINFPATGCWQVTGSFGGHSLSFVTNVEAATESAPAESN